MQKLLLLSFAVASLVSAKTNLNFQAAADYLEARNGHAMLVYQGDELVFEKYFNGHTADKAHLLASGTKSFCGVIAARAVDDKLLDLDEPVSLTITEWQNDVRLAEVTIRQLLSLCSGIDAGKSGKVPSYAEAIQTKALHKPGTKFQYGPIPFQVFGELMKRKLNGEDALAYLDRCIFKPIGLKVSFWRKDQDGNTTFPSGAFLTAREWAKFGLLVRDGGQWKGEQLVSKESLAECFKPSPAQKTYGMTFWLGTGGRLPKDLVMAAGKGKQKLFIMPSKDLLVVQLAQAKPSYREQQFLSLLLGKDTGGTVGTDPAGNPGSAAMFKRMDKNDDGVITKDEVRLQAAFTRADADSDGKVTREEFAAWWTSRKR